MNIKVQTIKNGKTRVYIIRQLPHDKTVKLGSKLFGETVIKIGE